MKYLSLIIVVLTFISCTQQRFIVLRNVPQSPTFTVIPANNSLYQIEYANMVEGALLGTGVSVLSRPTIKQVTTKRQLGESSLSDEELNQIDRDVERATLIEKYRAYDGIMPDYLIATYAENERGRIEKTATDEVLASFIIEKVAQSEQKKTSMEILREVLKGMGVIAIDK